MGMKGKFAAALLFALIPFQVASSITRGTFDVAGLNKVQIEDHFKKLVGQSFKTSGVVKDAEEMQRTPDIAYEMPAYWYDGTKYVRYGYIYQCMGNSTVFLADNGYLSLFVKKNAVDHPVLASGKIVDGTKIAGLPKGVVVLIESLRLKDGAK